jgi:hypothetical protein
MKHGHNKDHLAEEMPQSDCGRYGVYVRDHYTPPYRYPSQLGHISRLSGSFATRRLTSAFEI